MALRPAAERAARIAEFKRRFPGRIPPVDIEPPGMHARRRATRAQQKAVGDLVDDHQRQLRQLSIDELKALEPVLDRAQAELAEQLRKWMGSTPDGELRWTAQNYRRALLLTGRISQALQLALERHVDGSTAQAQDLALEHLEAEVARFSEVFGDPQRIALNRALQVATGRGFIIPRVRTSSVRYGRNIAADIQQRLAIDILKGASVYETTERLVQERGPRGWVSVKGVAGEEGAISEFIPEGLFARYRFWAERIVRTETASAYGLQRQRGLLEAHQQLPHLRKRWFADGSACSLVCLPIAGMVVDVHGMFPTPRGSVEHEPAHPNCGCTTQPWSDDWPSLLGDIDPAFRRS